MQSQKYQQYSQMKKKGNISYSLNGYNNQNQLEQTAQFFNENNKNNKKFQIVQPQKMQGYYIQAQKINIKNNNNGSSSNQSNLEVSSNVIRQSQSEQKTNLYNNNNNGNSNFNNKYVYKANQYNIYNYTNNNSN